MDNKHSNKKFEVLTNFCHLAKLAFLKLSLSFSGVLPWLHMFINWWNRSLVIKNSCALENSMGLARRHSFFLFIPPFCRGPPTINSIHEMLHGSLLHRMTFSHDFYNSPTSPTRCTPRPPCCPNILVKNKCAGPWLNDKKLLPIFILKVNLLRGVLLVYTQCSFGFTGVKFWTAPEGTVCESYVLYVPILWGRNKWFVQLCLIFHKIFWLYEFGHISTIFPGRSIECDNEKNCRIEETKDTNEGNSGVEVDCPEMFRSWSWISQLCPTGKLVMVESWQHEK